MDRADWHTIFRGPIRSVVCTDDGRLHQPMRRRSANFLSETMWPSPSRSKRSGKFVERSTQPHEPPALELLSDRRASRDASVHTSYPWCAEKLAVSIALPRRRPSARP